MKKDLCIIVPYRDRAVHLEKFAPTLNNFLQNEGLTYEILIVEQAVGKVFNRGSMKNIGFNYAKGKFSNYVFHDIDMLPISGKASYQVVDVPTHYAAIVEQFGWNLAYSEFAGGVIAFTQESFEKSNGYSNLYWGWGAEDDDLYKRCVERGIKVMRRHNMYASLQHDRPIKQDEYQKNLALYSTWRDRIDSDGLSSLKYNVVDNTTTDLYTKIIVEI